MRIKVSIITIVWVVAIFSLGQLASAQILVTVYPDNIMGVATKTGFSNTASGDSDLNYLLTFFGNSNFRNKTAFGAFHRIPVRQNVNVQSIINYDNSIGRTPILLLEMDSIRPDNIKSFLDAHPTYLNSVTWIEIGNEPWSYDIPDPNNPGLRKYSFDWRAGTTGALNYAADLLSYISEIRSRKPDMKILISSAEGNYFWWSNARWTQDILGYLVAHNAYVDGLAFHVYPDFTDNLLLEPFPLRYLAVPEAINRRWVTRMAEDSIAYNQLNGIGVPQLLRLAINNSGYKTNPLRLFATEYSLFANSGADSSNVNIRSTMLNALVYAGLVVQLSNSDVDTLLMHQLGNGDNLTSSDGVGWNVINIGNRLRPFGYAVKLLSKLYPTQVKTTMNTSPTFTITVDNGKDSQGVSPLNGAIPQYATSSYIQVAATINAKKDTIAMAVVNLDSTQRQLHIDINTLKSIGTIDMFRLQAGNFGNNLVNTDDYLDNNETSDRVVIKTSSLSAAGLGIFNVPRYSITVLKIKLNP